jgi:hypothetical protein|tara:strand:+ start:2466 stop:3329 length:864 start_codon:yes stop_codon:yes gene_type:complete
MAEQAVKKEIVKKPIKYKRNDNSEEENLKTLVAERDATLQQEEEEKKDAEETDSLNPEEKTFKKRYGDLRRYTQQKEDDYKKEILKLKEQVASTVNKEIKMPKSEEELAAWSSKYPDVAQVIETIATKKAKELDSSLEERMKIIAEKEAYADRARAEVELMSSHPDFDDIRNDQKFHDWVETQPKLIQQALYENDSDAKAAARAIDLYKSDMGMTQTKKTFSNKDAAKAVSKGASASPAPTKDKQSNQFKESQVAKMTAQQFEKNEDAIMSAIRSGDFIYDVSRPAT